MFVLETYSANLDSLQTPSQDPHPTRDSKSVGRTEYHDDGVAGVRARRRARLEEAFA